MSKESYAQRKKNRHKKKGGLYPDEQQEQARLKLEFKKNNYQQKIPTPLDIKRFTISAPNGNSVINTAHEFFLPDVEKSRTLYSSDCRGPGLYVSFRFEETATLEATDFTPADGSLSVLPYAKDFQFGLHVRFFKPDGKFYNAVLKKYGHRFIFGLAKEGCDIRENCFSFENGHFDGRVDYNPIQLEKNGEYINGEACFIAGWMLSIFTRSMRYANEVLPDLIERHQGDPKIEMGYIQRV